MNMSWDLVRSAESVLESLSVVFFLEDFDKFEPAFARDELLPVGDKSCSLEQANPTMCSNCTKQPTEIERQLIRNHNWMDIALYEAALKAPNRVANLGKLGKLDTA